MIRFALAAVVLVALQFVPVVGMGEAKAACQLQSGPADPTQRGATWVGCASASEAYAKAQEFSWSQDRWKLSCAGTYTGMKVVHEPANKKFQAYALGSGCGGQYPHSSASYVAINCPEGTTWDEPSLQCFDPQVCLAKPPLGESFATGPAPFDVACVDGCAFESGGGVDVLLPRSDGTWLGTTSGWEPTGEACPAGAPTAEGATTPQVCEPAPDGQTFCIKPDGQHCYSLTNGSGRQICWQPGETGEKADADILQKRNVGDTPIAPQTLPPEGDTFIQEGTPITKQTTIGDRTFTTTTTNYKTGSGADAKPGSPGDGEPGDGSGGDGEGEGDGTYPEGGTDGSTGASESDTAIWKTFSSDDLLGALDDSGFLVAARTCPPIPELDFGPLGVFNPNVAGWCDFVDAFGKLLLFVAAIGALTIIAR